jgi:nicotinamide-nucleotide amidase
MLLEMISTGEEVLSGQIVDTNAAWFADCMMNLGIELQRRSTVGDRLDDLCNIFRERSQCADFILVNGGLGPTSDDLSAEAAAMAAGVPLIEHPGWRAHLEAWFRKRGRPMAANNLKQCWLPQGAVLVDNPAGSAPGFRLQLNRAWLFFTPGVPVEFKTMVNDQFVPFLQQAAASQFSSTLATRMCKLLTFGHGESTLAARIDQLPLPAGITLGYRPSAPHVEIKVFARGAAALAQQEAYLAQLQTLLGDAVVSTRFATLAEEVHHLLLAQTGMLALAESCSGGMLSSALIDFPGSSHYLQHSIVSYANAAKVALLQVDAASLGQHGAVSAETAIAMATGTRTLLDAEFALAITGIAGPEGGSEDKPVGTVAIALCDRQMSWVQVVQLGQRSRNLVRSMSCAVALDMLRRRLLSCEPLVSYPFVPAQRAYQEAHH